MTTENPHALQLVQAQLPTTLGDQARHAAAVEVLTDALKVRREQVRAELGASLRAAAEAEGVDGATRKLSGLGTVTLTAPEPHVRVTDDQALGAWLADGQPLGAELAPRAAQTERTTELGVLRQLQHYSEPLPASATKAELRRQLDRLRELIVHGTELGSTWLLPEKAAELVEEHPDTRLVAPITEPVAGSDRPRLHPGYVIHQPTGEQLPGCEVTLAASQVTVKIDRPVRQAEVARLREALGW